MPISSQCQIYYLCDSVDHLKQEQKLNMKDMIEALRYLRLWGKELREIEVVESISKLIAD